MRSGEEVAPHLRAALGLMTSNIGASFDGNVIDGGAWRPAEPFGRFWRGSWRLHQASKDPKAEADTNQGEESKCCGAELPVHRCPRRGSADVAPVLHPVASRVWRL